MFSALAYSRLFFCIFASRRVAEWSRRWTLKPRCRHRCGFDPYVCQGFKAPSLAQGFADFPAWNIPTRLVTLREPHICKTVVHFAVGKLLRFKVRFKIRIKLRPRFRDSVGPRDSVRIRPTGRVMFSLELAYFKGLGWVSLRWSQGYIKTRGKIDYITIFPGWNSTI
jgi:hypothetical protein